MIGILRERRSIRNYQDKDIEPEKIEKLKEAAVRSPSSRNFNPWRFVFVTDSGLIEKLAKAKEHGSDFLAGAPLGVVVCGEEEKSDVWIEDCSIASILLQLTAQSLDLGSCWIQIRNRDHSEEQSAEEYVRKQLEIPDKYRIESIISIGYPAERREGVPESELEFNKIKENLFTQ